MNRSVVTILLATVLAVGILVPGAGPADASVFQDDTRWPRNSAGLTVVPVCVLSSSTAQQSDEAGISHPQNPSLDDVVGQVRDSLRESWERETSVRFTDWRGCNLLTADEKADTIPLYIHPNAENTSLVGIQAKGVARVPDTNPSAATSFKPWGNGRHCVRGDGLTTGIVVYDFLCAREYGAHEFGHALGFLHEWQHPLTPESCSRSREETEKPLAASETATTFADDAPYTVVNPTFFDRNSLMTYDDVCAAVDGPRFGNIGLNTHDAAGAREVYPAPPEDPTSVGVIPDVPGGCPAGTSVIINTDNEDVENKNDRGGWNGGVLSGRNTRWEFCKVAGDQFGRLRQTFDPGTSAYSVLKLGTTCPTGASEWIRTTDDEDGRDGLMSTNWMAGPAGPNSQNEEDRTYTSMHWCLFEEAPSGATMDQFPDLGFEYGVVAPRGGVFARGQEEGFVTMDTEDTDTADQLTDGARRGLGLSQLEAILTMLDVSGHTTYSLVRVAGNLPPTVDFVAPDTILEGTPTLFTADGRDPNGSPLTYTWQVDGGEPTTDPVLTFADGFERHLVTVTATDPDGLQASAQQRVLVEDVAPSVTVEGDSVVESGTATVSVSVTDPGLLDTYDTVVDWGDGTSETIRHAEGLGREFDLTHTYPDDDADDSFPVVVTVVDTGSTVRGSAATVVEVANVAPSVSASAAPLVEGGVAHLGLTVQDAGILDTFTVDIDWGDGRPVQQVVLPAAEAGRQGTVVDHLYADDDPTGTAQDTYPVVVTVTDDDGGSTRITAPVEVSNVVPVLTSLTSSSTFAAPAAEREPVQLEATFTDRGVDDLHTAVVDWGDGTTSPATITESAPGESTLLADHEYATGGVYSVAVRLEDDDTGVTVGITQAVVSGVGVHDGVLQIIGTQGRDEVRVRVKDGALEVRASFDEPAQRVDASQLRSIYVLGFDGDDKVSIDRAVALPATIFAGAGDDDVAAGGGSTTILGGQGRDHLTGGDAADLLFGGDGDDHLDGKKGADVEEGGSGTDRCLGRTAKGDVLRDCE